MGSIKEFETYYILLPKYLWEIGSIIKASIYRTLPKSVSKDI